MNGPVQEAQASGAQRLTQLRRRGRRGGTALFGLLVSGVTALWSLQICLQVWAPNVPETKVDCPTGILQLVNAVERARAAAAGASGERDALAAFRKTLEQDWQLRPAIGSICAKDRQSTLHLREVDRLRYAEDHAVRYRAADLASRRRAVDALRASLETPTSRFTP